MFPKVSNSAGTCNKFFRRRETQVSRRPFLYKDMNLGERFSNAFIKYDRWELYFEGLGTTLIIAVIAVVIGVVIGILLALINYVNKRTGKLKPLAAVAQVYITVIRGTPVVLQMFMMYLVIFASMPIDLHLGDLVWRSGGGILIGGITFGINSSAYVSEIVRAGFESVDDGQMEAGRSLGLSTAQTMGSVITPQAVRNVLPPLFNEFIILVKETAIIGYVGVYDLGKIPSLIQSRTFDIMPPLVIAAVLYLIVVMALTLLLKLLEKWLAKSDRSGGYKPVRVRKSIFRKNDDDNAVNGMEKEA